jgi:hypothetical protein
MIHFIGRDEQGDFPTRRFMGRFRLVAAGVFAVSVAGCSMTFPLPSFMSDDATGSIKPRPTPFAADLDPADWRLAEPSLAQALQSDGSNEPKQWSNPASGHRGAFQPVAGAFKRDGQTCRAFLARIDTPDRTKTMQAVGCLMAGGAVFVDQAEPWKAL